MSSSPVLLVGFNRPDLSRRVFSAIRDAKPESLYVAVDGPRDDHPADAAQVDAVRSIVDDVDWDCDVHTLFREQNVGCKLGVSTAVDWLFDNVESGIILEDDCVPSPSFFQFCDEMLSRYADDTRIMHIAGYNHRPDFVWDPDYSYYFSHYGYMWGWATWRRAWSMYEKGLPHFDEIVDKGYLKTALPGRLARTYHLKKIRDAMMRDSECWDYEWDFVRMSNSGLSIVPHTNLIHNIGFGEGATHTVSAKNPSFDNLAGEIEFPLRHPEFVMCDVRSDRAYFTQLARWTVYRKLMGLMGRDGYSIDG